MGRKECLKTTTIVDPVKQKVRTFVAKLTHDRTTADEPEAGNHLVEQRSSTRMTQTLDTEMWMHSRRKSQIVYRKL